jgi:hypothetical protein
VVDPGVGSKRRRLAAEGDGYRFVGPDNGVLSLALDTLASCNVRELTNARYRRATVSPTFEGRDWFAPVAGWLASGLPIESLGPTVADIERVRLPRPRMALESIEGEVLRVDHFGNLVTNIDRASLAEAVGESPRILVAGHVLDGLAETYAAVERGALCALFGSTGHLEIAASGGSAAAVLNAGRGTVVRASRNA